MQKIKNFFLTLLLGELVMIVISCGKDKETPTINKPTVTVTASSVSSSSGEITSLSSGDDVFKPDTVKFQVSFSALGGFNTLYNGSNAINRNDLNLEAGTTMGSRSFVLETKDIMVGRMVSTMFFVVDDLNQSSDTSTFEFKIVAKPSSNVKSFSAIMVGGFLNADLGSFYSVLEDSVYTLANASMNSQKIDFLFYYVDMSSVRYTIAALDNSEAASTLDTQVSGGTIDRFETKNSTRFTTYMSTPNFDAVKTNEDLEKALAGDHVSMDVERVTSLVANDVFGFKLATSRGNKSGLIKVVRTDDGSQGGSGRMIEINVKLHADQ